MKALLFVVGGGALVGSAVYSGMTRFESDVTVVKKFDRPMNVGMWDVDAVKVLMVEGQDGTQYQVSVNPWFLQFNPTSLWNDLKEGETYHLKGFGRRAEPMSLYPTIYEAK